MMGLLGWMVLGIVIGLMGGLMEKDKSVSKILGAIILGISGSLLGGVSASLLFSEGSLNINAPVLLFSILASFILITISRGLKNINRN